MSNAHGYPYVAPWPGDLQPDCPHTGTRSCRKCDGTADDERELRRAMDERHAQVRHLMRTDRAYRWRWLAEMPPSYRAVMAQAADRSHGPMPGLVDEIELSERLTRLREGGQ